MVYFKTSLYHKYHLKRCFVSLRCSSQNIKESSCSSHRESRDLFSINSLKVSVEGLLDYPVFFLVVFVMLAEPGVVHCSVKFTDVELETLRDDTFGSQDCIDVD